MATLRTDRHDAHDRVAEDVVSTPRPSAWLPEPRAEALPVTRSLAADLATVLLLFVAWRGLLFGADYVGRAMTIPRVQHLHYAASPFWDGYVRHDSLHYADVIRRGYRVQPVGPFKGMAVNAAFFPLYPYTVKALARVKIPGYGRLFGTIWAPGLIVSNVALILSLVYMLRIARLYLDEDGARRSLVYLLAFPTSFFFSAFYTESVFLLTTTAAFYHFFKGQHARCGVWGLLAATSRSPGVMLVPAFVLGHLWARRFRVSRSDLSLLWLGLIPCGILLYMGMLYAKLGDPMAFMRAQSAWGRSFTMPHRTLWAAVTSINWSLPLGNFGNTNWAFEFSMGIVFLALPLLLLRGFHKALPIFALLLILMPLTTGVVAGMPRYAAVAFPSFFALAKLGENRAADRLIVFGSALLLGLLKVAFSNGFMIF